MLCRILFLILCKLIFLSCYYISPGYHTNITLNNFAFGSCFQGFLSDRLDIFRSIDNENPELWLWLGDATYLDNLTLNYFTYPREFDAYHVEKMFNLTKYDKYYSSFEKKHPILGVWDDHDYALNDANGYYPFKEQTKNFYLDFLDEPIHSGRRTEGKGIYTTYSFGVLNSHKTVRMILLDVRYNKTSYIRDTFEADILGEEQWAWLEETLMISQETFIFIASGTQILPFTRLTTESWYSKSRERLFELIGKVKKNGIVLLSGDIHCAELLKTFCVHPDIGYEIYEITSSGMSHFCDFKFFFELFVNNDYNIIPFIDTYNFGKIEFQWGKSKEESKFTIKFIDIERTIRGEYTINYNDLIYKKVDEKIDFYHRDCKTRLYSRFKSPLEYYFYYKNNLKGFLLVISGYILILSFFIGLLNLLLLIIRKPFNYIFKKKSLVKQE